MAKSKQIQKPSRPVKIVVVNSRYVLVGGTTYPPGSEIEIIGQDSITHVGISPSPRKYSRIDLYNEAGEFARYSSETGEWKQVDSDSEVPVSAPDVVQTIDQPDEDAPKPAAKK